MATISFAHYNTVRVVHPGKSRWFGVGRWRSDERKVFTATVHFPYSGLIERSVSITGKATNSHINYADGDRESFWVKLENTGTTVWSDLRITYCYLTEE
ncbi:hypothetical protein ACFTWD_09425 [Streptomyces sp. NPDC056943]|uniref:hypothetical protein n=1 Tax=Streptomyces sp. NPDC056943 TaxID=3345971 RepID=UPI0036326685